ncbi:transformation system protein [Nautilia profundicola AmH]|uniref:Transformation system protein n=1 Tax=Nautilia profundicola (strain ATCC BAA-1463 / DSM 18972 / AmH) TaxID=598659 RepID=B9L7V3_NAUPA|nr:transformation system protein [Nautilia profundicola AmH]
MKKSFTLLELLFVIVIIGILSAVVTVKFFSFKTKKFCDIYH